MLFSDWSKLLPVNGTKSDLDESARYGFSASLSKNGLHALVGSPYKDAPGDFFQAGAAYVFSRPTVSSIQWTQQAKLLAGDGTALVANALFGTSVALSDDGVVALIGAHYVPESGLIGSGAAYVFERPSTSSSLWTQRAKLLPGDGGEVDAFFGLSVSLSGDGLVALIGAVAKDESGVSNAGAVYVFSRPALSLAWSQQAKLLAGDGTDVAANAQFGWSVSLSGDGLVALIGAYAYGEGEFNISEAGAAYVFSRTSSSSTLWTQQAKLFGVDMLDPIGARFGYSVSLSANGIVALVGAYRKDEGGVPDSGVAYVFSRPTTTSSKWSQQTKLVAGDLEAESFFGYSVSLSGDGLVALVGSHWKDESSLSDTGASYLFSRPTDSSSSWTQAAKLLAGNGTDLERGAKFGGAVSLSGDGMVALVGSVFKDESDVLDSGSAYVALFSSTPATQPPPQTAFFPVSASSSLSPSMSPSPAVDQGQDRLIMYSAAGGVAGLFLLLLIVLVIIRRGRGRRPSQHLRGTVELSAATGIGSLAHSKRETRSRSSSKSGRSRPASRVASRHSGLQRKSSRKAGVAAATSTASAHYQDIVEARQVAQIPQHYQKLRPKGAHNYDQFEGVDFTGYTSFLIP